MEVVAPVKFLMKMKYFLTIILFCCSLILVGQKERSFIREGIALYKAGKYAEADKKYDEALKINPTSIEAKFNKADALYQLKKYEDAQKLYQQVADLSADKNIKSKAYHNMGNTFLKSEKFQESVDAYKNALRLNPNDKDSKYNLSYAMNKLKQQNDKNKKDDQNKKDENKKDQNKNDKNKDDKNQNKDNKPGDDQKKKEEQNKKDNEGKNGEQKKQEEQKQAQPQKAKISKEQADQILKSLENEEKKLQQKLLLQKTKVKKHKVDKDW
jgi:Ca-activated chloride channel family protein